MNAAMFRRMALAMEGAIESAHMGHPDFRANGKIFATLHTGDKTGMVKLPQEEQARFVGAAPGAFSPAAGAWGRQGCTIVTLALADEETLGEAMTLAWQVAAKARSAPRATPGARSTRKSPAARKRKSKRSG
jgi:hypothetical protein